MLPKQSRLNLKFDFTRVVKGRSYLTPHLKIYSLMEEQPNPRVGISIPKRFYKKAHDRNRARRLISQAVQNSYPSLRKELSLVIMPKADVNSLTVSELEEELRDIKTLYSAH